MSGLTNTFLVSSKTHLVFGNNLLLLLDILNPYFYKKPVFYKDNGTKNIRTDEFFIRH